MLDFVIVLIVILAGQAFCNYIKLAPSLSFCMGFIVACVMVMTRLKSWIA